VGIALNRLKDFKSIERRHAQVEDRDVEHILSQRPQCLSPVRDLCDIGERPTRLAEDRLVQQELLRIVVGEEDPDDAGFGGRHVLLSTSAGRPHQAKKGAAPQTEVYRAFAPPNFGGDGGAIPGGSWAGCGTAPWGDLALYHCRLRRTERNSGPATR